MRRVNLDKEIEHLHEKKVNGYEAHYTDGVIIKISDMSQYFKLCFKESKSLEHGINGRLKYRYFLDEKNKICILFTETFIEDQNDKNEIAAKAGTIVIETYFSEEEFEESNMGQYYHFHIVVPGRDNYWWENINYYTDCEAYNELPLVKAMARLSRRPDKIRRNTLDDIINY